MGNQEPLKRSGGKAGSAEGLVGFLETIENENSVILLVKF